MADRPSLFTLTHFDVQPPPADVMRAWDEACMIAYNLGRKPVVNFPIGLASERITALIDQATGEAIPVNWLPAERFPSRLPAQYFNPDLILPEVPSVADLDIAAFLRARLDEREAVAHACTPGPWRWGDWSTTFGTREEFRRTLESSSNKEPFPAIVQRGDGTARVLPSLEDPIEYAADDEPFEANAQHIVDNDPQFVLADVAAKRQMIEWALDDDGENGLMRADNIILGEYGSGCDLPEHLLTLLALPYAGHPDYREEWKP